MNKRKFDTRDLVARIEKITRDRMSKESVVSIRDLRKVKDPDPYTLLIIEDDETIRLALKRIFEGEGYRVLSAADGTQLSAVLGDQMIHLIILDIGLPWVNGFELAELMKNHEDLSSIPLIFLSGRNSEEDIKRGFAVGADDFITKPFDIEKVKKTVQTLVRLAHD